MIVSYDRSSQDRSHVGRGRRHRPRGVRGAGGRCQGGIDPVLDSAGVMHIEELLDEEVTALAGERYARKDPSVGGRRHGSNPGTVGLAGQRVPIRVPRIRPVTEREIPLRSYEALHGDRAVNDLLLRRVLYGISCRNYAAAAEAIPGAIGLSGSTVSRASFRPARRNSANSRSGTSPGRTLWPSCWTARRSPRRRWSSRWASR